MQWNKKDLLGLEYLCAEEINLILDTAESFKEVSSREIKKVPAPQAPEATPLPSSPPPAAAPTA